MIGDNFAKQTFILRADFPFFTGIAADKGREAGARAKEADQAGRHDDGGKRNGEEEDRYKGDRCQRLMGRLFRERRPILMIASTTIASTAAFKPKNAAATKPT